MSMKYAYSLYGDRFTGAFDTAEEALAAAVAKANALPEPPSTVFVGRIIPPNLHAHGHARHVLRNMLDRVKAEYGEAADAFLRNLTKQQVKALDETLEAGILAWLRENRLMPDYFRVGGISEHPVPARPMAVAQPAAPEVHSEGTQELP